MSFSDQYRALHDGAGLIDKSPGRGRLLLTGADRRAYLQGLLTNDIVALGPGTGCYAAYLTAQGRMIADMRVFETGDGLLVDLDATLTSAVRDRWSMFIFSEDVQIEDLSSSTAELGVYGPRAAQILAATISAGGAASERSSSAAALEAMPLHGNEQTHFRTGRLFVLRSDDAGVPGFDVVLAADDKDAFVGLLRAAGAIDIEPEAAEASRVEAGRPLFRVDMTTETIPLEAGIEDRAISLTKGCYVGQEVIIRVLHRGHGRVARRLVGLTFEPSAPVPSPGDVVRTDDRDVGLITSAVRSPALGVSIALGYVHRDFAAAGTVLSVRGAAATVTSLPFVPAGGSPIANH
jgi:folate-binding protein YgfZ